MRDEPLIAVILLLMVGLAVLIGGCFFINWFAEEGRIAVIAGIGLIASGLALLFVNMAFPPRRKVSRK